MMRVMQQKSSADSELPIAKEYIQTYLTSDIEIPVCIEAWCYGMLGRFEMIMGNKEQADKYLEKANTLDPYFSKAFAIPSVDNPPNEQAFTYRSYFKPF